MPSHESNTVGSVAARLARSRRLAADLRRSRRGGAPPAPPSAGEADRTDPDQPLTTADATIVPVDARRPGRYRRLAWGPGEPHLVRAELGIEPGPDRIAARRSLLYVAHHTDTHICDAQSPARLEGGEAYGWVNPGSDAGHRPQETCTTQVFDRLVAATNAVAVSPQSGAPMAWCIQTGDNTDNRTAAEVRWWLDVLAGRPVTPNTGAEGRYEGLQRGRWRSIWHPDRPGWDRRQRAGFPYLPGFLDAAVGPFQPAGLAVPWLAVFGNHDQIFAGTFGPGRFIRLDRLEEMLAGTSRKPTSAVGLVRAVLHASIVGPDPDRWERWSRRGPGTATVTADPEARRSLPLDDYLAAILTDHEDGQGRGPAGHGFSAANLAEHTSWWSRPEGDHIQVIGLDTCNHTAGDGGAMGPRQTAWLEAELARHHTRWRDSSGRPVDGDGPDRLVVLVSHHNSWTMANHRDDEYDPGPRTLGPDLVDLLDRFPNVVLWLNGHSHEHRIVPNRRTTPGGGPAGDGDGWWEVNTASAIDFAQQGRTVELFDNADGTISILVTVLDHLAPPTVEHRRGTPWTTEELASVSRELSANDDNWIDPASLRGDEEDRNVELVVRAPFPLA